MASAMAVLLHDQRGLENYGHFNNLRPHRPGDTIPEHEKPQLLYPSLPNQALGWLLQALLVISIIPTES